MDQLVRVTPNPYVLNHADASLFLARFALLAIMHMDTAGAALQMIDDARDGMTEARTLQMISIDAPASR
jgi:hypothetical protein